MFINHFQARFCIELKNASGLCGKGKAEAYRSELEGNRLITETIPNLEPEINTQVEGSVEDLTPESANV